jgi:hypothetical protein
MTKLELRNIWEERISVFKASGQTQDAWCLDQNLNVQQLRYWLKKSKKIVQPSVDSPGWLSLNVSNHQENFQDNTMCVKVGHAVIELKSGFNQELFRDVVKVLESIC